MSEIIDKAKTIRAQIEAVAQYAPDEEALTYKTLYPTWESYIGKSLTAGIKVRYQDKPYKVVQAISVVLENQPPSLDTAALYTAIDETHAGTKEDPIPAVAGMEYEKGKYYSDGGKLYLMNRQGMNDGDKITLYYLPSQLVGQYFEEAA